MITIKKPKLSFWQIFNMNVGFLGIQYSFGLQQSAINPIFLFPVGTSTLLDDKVSFNKVIFPAVGLINPAIDLSIVDLPDPEGPIILKISPFSRKKETLSSIFFEPIL